MFHKERQPQPTFLSRPNATSPISKFFIHLEKMCLSLTCSVSLSLNRTPNQSPQHRQLSTRNNIAILQNNILKLGNYLTVYEISPHQKHDSHPILVDCATEQVSIQIKYNSNDFIVKPLESVFFKSITTFQNKFKTPNKKRNK